MQGRNQWLQTCIINTRGTFLKEMWILTNSWSQLLKAASGKFSISWFLPSSQESTWTCKGSTARCFPFGLEGNMTAAAKRIPFPEHRRRVIREAQSCEEMLGRL